VLDGADCVFRSRDVVVNKVSAIPSFPLFFPHAPTQNCWGMYRLSLADRKFTFHDRISKTNDLQKTCSGFVLSISIFSQYSCHWTFPGRILKPQCVRSQPLLFGATANGKKEKFAISEIATDNSWHYWDGDKKQNPYGLEKMIQSSTPFPLIVLRVFEQSVRYLSLQPISARCLNEFIIREGFGVKSKNHSESWPNIPASVQISCFTDNLKGWNWKDSMHQTRLSLISASILVYSPTHLRTVHWKRT